MFSEKINMENILFFWVNGQAETSLHGAFMNV